jgi:chromosome transmission fidelity protein 18
MCFRHLHTAIRDVSANSFDALSSSNQVAAKCDLWTDRYKPIRFTDLIGDERVHRETLAWVKEWDFCVYGPQKATGKSKGKKRARDDAFAISAGPNGKDEDWKENKDEWKRPKEKVTCP